VLRMSTFRAVAHEKAISQLTLCLCSFSCHMFASTRGDSMTSGSSRGTPPNNWPMVSPVDMASLSSSLLLLELQKVQFITKGTKEQSLSNSK
jgi:hypothetical protein